MSILIDQNTRVVIQGITGREGQARAKLMKDYGTNVVAGVTPGRQGEMVYGIPVYDTVEEAVERQGQLDASVIFIPAAMCKAAAFEAINAGVKLWLSYRIGCRFMMFWKSLKKRLKKELNLWGPTHWG